MELNMATPTNLTIVPRNLKFGRNEKAARWYHGGDPVASAFYNALSLTFPRGEAMFVETVRHFRDVAPEPLKSQIGDFVKQEIMHTREHVAFNKQVVDAGYDVTEIDRKLEVGIEEGRAAHPVVRLAVTVALEHYTAVLAHAWLKDERHLAGMPEEVRRLWQWHSIEEIEHKGVAYDTLMVALKDISPFKRWMLRSRVMLTVTRTFWYHRAKDMALLLKQDGLNTKKTWLKVAAYVLFKPGLLRQCIPAWLAYFKPGFHPWDHDDRALIRKVEATLVDGNKPELKIAA
jgi:uncharacterized protein